MDDLAEYDKTIQDEINYIQYELKRTKKKKGADKEKAIRSLSTKVKATQKILLTYEMQLSIAPNSQKLKYEDKYQEKVTKLTELNVELKNMKKEMEKDQFLTDIHAVNHLRKDEETNKKSVGDMNKQEIVNFGNKRLDKADKELDDATKILMQGRDLNNDIQIELERQKKQLMETREKAKDTQSLMKRSKKLISYFQKQLMTDKIIQCFLVVILIAIVVIIALRFVKK